MTVKCSAEDNLPDGSDALRLLAHGSPLGRTLEAAATVAASIQDGVGCCILLVSDDRLSLAAAHGVGDADQQLLRRLCHYSLNDCLAALQQDRQAEVRLLVTAAAELIGAVVLFGPADWRLTADSGERPFASRLDEVCAISMLAIEGKNLVDELYFRAHHDALTRTWNRLWMEQQVMRVLDEATDRGCSTGLMLIGIDSFRTINDVLGSQVGNDVLREIAFRLSEVLRPEWSLARCGGDEFLVLLPDLVGPDELAMHARNLLTLFQQPFEIGDHELFVRATIGTSISGPGESGGEELQNRAESALRHGKRCARSRVTSFSDSIVSTPPGRREMERHLRFALQKREFELFYQPQIQLSTGKLLGAEALLRWRHPSLGFISPAIFVPIAEQIGIIDEIGAWVLSEAIRQLEIWHRSGFDRLRMAVNVSALQFSKDDFASYVAKCLRRADIRAGDLELEITESAVMTDFDHGVRQIKLLRSLGVLIAVDDFGTGHSSLAYLQQLPIQRIKIDRMFIKDLASEEESHPLLSSIIQMARALGCDVIAEGIETAEQAMAIASLDCDEVQGFFFSRPLPASEFVSWAQGDATYTSVQNRLEAKCSSLESRFAQGR